MLTEEQKEFYYRWRIKADAVDAKSIEQCVDKYVTQFINYNFLYNLIPGKVVQNTGKILDSRFDKISATKNVIYFIGANELLRHLSEHDCDSDIEMLQAVMTHFNICLDKKGNPKKTVDKSLTTDLMSQNDETKALALLETLYYIRCNIVHGRKELQQYQVMLLHPIINLISSINILLSDALILFPF